MIIAKTASRNVAFKSGKLAESVFTSPADELATEGLSFNDSEVSFQDLGYNNYNADLRLYIFNF